MHTYVSERFSKCEEMAMFSQQAPVSTDAALTSTLCWQQNIGSFYLNKADLMLCFVLGFIMAIKYLCMLRVIWHYKYVNS